MPRQRVDDDANDRRVAEHSGFHGGDLGVSECGIDLAGDDLRRDEIDRADGLSRLRRQGSDGGVAVHSVLREGAKIGLDAGAAARV
jgi:hypothetical protein